MKNIVFEQGNLGIDYEILTRQCAEFRFKDGKVKYFSVSTQWDTADTIEDAIRNILEADKKYDGKAPSIHLTEEEKRLYKLMLDNPNGVKELMKDAQRVIMSPLYYL